MFCVSSLWYRSSRTSNGAPRIPTHYIPSTDPLLLCVSHTTEGNGGRDGFITRRGCVDGNVFTKSTLCCTPKGRRADHPAPCNNQEYFDGRVGFRRRKWHSRSTIIRKRPRAVSCGCLLSLVLACCSQGDTPSVALNDAFRLSFSACFGVVPTLSPPILSYPFLSFLIQSSLEKGGKI